MPAETLCLPQRFRTILIVQDDAVDRVPAGAVGLGLGRIGFMRRRYETFPDV